MQPFNLSVLVPLVEIQQIVLNVYTAKAPTQTAQFLIKRSQNPGTQNPGTQNPGIQNLGTQNPGTQNRGTQVQMIIRLPGISENKKINKIF